MKRLLFIFAFVLCAASSPARAGIPVLDVANLVEAVLSFLQGVEDFASQVSQIENQVNQIRQLDQQITQLGKQLDSINGIRGLVDVLNNPLLRNYIPADAAQTLTQIYQTGYQGLTTAAKLQRDANMIYNCGDVTDARQRAQCQATLARSYQDAQFFKEAMNRSGQRMDQIIALQQSAASAADPKAQSEAQARIGVEQAMLQHELTQVQLVAAQAGADRDVRVSQSLERGQERAARTGRAADIFN